MLLYLFQTVGTLATTTSYERQFTENRHLPIDYQTSHRSTREALTRRAQLVCDSPYSLQDRTDYRNNVFSKNNYNADSERRNTHSNANSKTKTNFNSGPVPLKLLHVYYTLQPITTFNYDFLLMSRAKKNRKQTGSIQDQMLRLAVHLHR